MKIEVDTATADVEELKVAIIMMHSCLKVQLEIEAKEKLEKAQRMARADKMIAEGDRKHGTSPDAHA